jgi:hypothetical protein
MQNKSDAVEGRLVYSEYARNDHIFLPDRKVFHKILIITLNYYYNIEKSKMKLM